MLGLASHKCCILLCFVAFARGASIEKGEEISIQDVPQDFQGRTADDTLASKIETEGRMMSSMMQRLRDLAHSSTGSSRRRGSYSDYNIYSQLTGFDRFQSRVKPVAKGPGSHAGPAHGLLIAPADFEFEPQEKPLFLKFAPKTEYDFKRIWLRMLYDVHRIMMDETILEYEPFSTKVLSKLFHLLRKITIFEKQKKDEPCPYSYDRAGHDLCLSNEPIAFDETTGEPWDTTWDEAREWCQQKGGDLFILRDAKDLRDAFLYLHKVADPGQMAHHWIGASARGFSDNTGFYQQIDGSKSHPGAPFVASGSYDQTTLAWTPDPNSDASNFAALFLDVTQGRVVEQKSDANILTINGRVSQRLAGSPTDYPFVPLCQYIHMRDGHLTQSLKPHGVGPLVALQHGIGDQIEEISEALLAQETPPTTVKPKLGDKDLPYLTIDLDLIS